MIFVSASGMKVTFDMSKRVKQLNELNLWLSVFKAQLEYTAKPINEILETIAERTQGIAFDFTIKCSEYIKSGEDLPSAWNMTVKDVILKSSIKKEERDLWLGLGGQLGTTDLCGQLAICSMYEELIKKSVDKAEKQRQKNGNIYSVLGVMSAIAIGIIFI